MGALINFGVPFFLPNFLRGLRGDFLGGLKAGLVCARAGGRARICVRARINKKNNKSKQAGLI